MYRRVLAIRDRDFLLIDTLNGHFDNFTREMQQPYTQWRKARCEEAAALRELENDALKRKLLGVAAILGAIAIEASGNGNNSGSGVLRDTLVLGGAYAIKTGFDKSAETGIHRDAIIELDKSFSSEAGPMVVEVEGETLRFAKAVIATGARAALPPVPGLAEAAPRTNETIFQLTERPRRLGVIGGGPIGCELAQAFQRLGVRVTVIDVAPQLLPREDPDAAAIVQAPARQCIERLADDA